MLLPFAEFYQATPLLKPSCFRRGDQLDFAGSTAGTAQSDGVPCRDVNENYPRVEVFVLALNGFGKRARTSMCSVTTIEYNGDVGLNSLSSNCSLS